MLFTGFIGILQRGSSHEGLDALLMTASLFCPFVHLLQAFSFIPNLVFTRSSSAPNPSVTLHISDLHFMSFALHLYLIAVRLTSTSLFSACRNLHALSPTHQFTAGLLSLPPSESLSLLAVEKSSTLLSSLLLFL